VRSSRSTSRWRVGIDGEVAWRPAVDVTRIALGGQMIALVALLVLRGAIRRLARR